MIKSSFSVKLSLILTFALGICLIILCAAFPFLVNWYYSEIRGMAELVPTLLAAFYLCVPPVAAAVVLFARLLFSIKSMEVFNRKNVARIRGISWCCLLVAAVTLICGFVYPPLFIVFAAGVFMGIILRVVKNVFEYAVDIKSENELTI